MAAVLASTTGSALSGHSSYSSLDFLDAQTSSTLSSPTPTLSCFFSLPRAPP
jgi:hypothetical protein